MTTKQQTRQLTREELSYGYYERAENEYDRADFCAVTLRMDGSRLIVRVYERDGGCVGESISQYTGDSVAEAYKVFRQECRRLGVKPAKRTPGGLVAK